MRIALITTVLCLFAAPAIAGKIFVANTDKSCHGAVQVIVYNGSDRVNIVPTVSKTAKKGHKIKVKCSHKRCKLTWNDTKGNSFDTAIVSAKKNSKKKPFVLKCSDDA